MKRTTGTGLWGKNPKATRSKDDPRTRGWSVQELARLTWGDLRHGKDGFDSGDRLIDILIETYHTACVKLFGREPHMDEPVFFDHQHNDVPQFRSPEQIQADMSKDMRAAGAPGHLIHAWEKTGLMLSQFNRRIHTPEQIRDWDKAITEYHEQRRQLMHFDDEKGWFVDNRTIKIWMIIWYPELELRADDYHGLLTNLAKSATNVKEFRRLGLQLDYETNEDGADYFEFWTEDREVAAKVAAELNLVWHRDTDAPDSDFDEDGMGIAMIRATGKARLLLSFAVPLEDPEAAQEHTSEHNTAICALVEEYGWVAPCGTIVVREYEDRPPVIFSLMWITMPEMPEQARLDEFRAEVEATVPALKMFEVGELDPLDF